MTENELWALTGEFSREAVTDRVSSLPEARRLLHHAALFYGIREVYPDRVRNGEHWGLLMRDYILAGHVPHTVTNTIVKVGDEGLPPTPSMATRAKNLGKAMFRFVAEGMPVESRAAAEARVKICESNACGYFDGSICRHAKCGCFTKIKTFLTTEHCPLGHW